MTAQLPDAVRLELLEALLETIDVGIVACDAAGHLTLFNAAARRFHGIPVDPTTAPEDWSERFDLFEADGVTRLRPREVPLYRTLLDESVADRLIAIAPPGSPPRLVRCDGQQLRDVDGTVTGAMVSMTDVTAADLAAAAIAEERALTRSVTTHCPEAYLATDERGRVVEWNPAAERLYGVAAADAMGRELHTVVVPADHGVDHGARLRAILRDSAHAGVEHRLPLTVECPDGRLLEVETTAWTRATEFGCALHSFVREALPGA